MIKIYNVSHFAGILFHEPGLLEKFEAQFPIKDGENIEEAIKRYQLTLGELVEFLNEHLPEEFTIDG